MQIIGNYDQVNIGIQLITVNDIVQENMQQKSNDQYENLLDLKQDGQKNIEVNLYDNILNKKKCKQVNAYLSRFMMLKKMKHKYLVSYIDAISSCYNQNKILLYSLNYENSLKDVMSQKIQDQSTFQEQELKLFAFQMVNGIQYLNNNKIELYYLRPQQIFVSKGFENFQIGDYAKFNIDSCQTILSSVNPNEITYLAPEIFLIINQSNESENFTLGFKGEIWSLGIIILNLLVLKQQKSLNKNEQIRFIKELIQLQFKYKDQSLFQKFPYLCEYDSPHERFLRGIDISNISIKFRDFLSKCLEMNPVKRYSAHDLKRHPFFDDIKQKDVLFIPQLVCSQIKIQQQLTPYQALQMIKQDTNYQSQLKLVSWIYPEHLLTQILRLASYNHEDELIEIGFLEIQNSSMKVPQIISSAIDSYLPLHIGKKGQNILLMNIERLLKILLQQVKEFNKIQFNLKDTSKSLDDIFFKCHKEIVPQKTKTPSNWLQKANLFSEKISQIISQEINEDQQEPQKQLLHDESLSKLMIYNYTYLLYESLLNDSQINSQLYFQYMREIPLINEIRIKYWKVILNIKYDSSDVYDLLKIDNKLDEDLIKSSQQIDFDIPRCHQYHSQFNSFNGKIQLQNVLNAVLKLNKKITYVQGMDAMAAVSLFVADFQENLACIFLNEIIDKCMNGMFDSQKDPYLVKEQLYIYKLVLYMLEPELAQYLDNIGFLPELYAVSWFYNLFAVLFPVDKVAKIWDLAICNSNIIPIFAATIMCDLKDKLLLMNLNDCMSNIRNLEGIIDLNSCLNLAGIVCEQMPGNFFIVNHKRGQKDDSMYKTEYYQQRPWEIPQEFNLVEQRNCFYITVFDMINLHNAAILLDFRSSQEFEEKCIVNSLYVHQNQGKISEVILEYLNLKQNQQVSLNTIGQNISNHQMRSKIEFVIIIQNHDTNTDQWSEQLIHQGIKFICILNGGMQAAELEAPEMIKFKNKSTQIGYFKKEIKNMKESK